MKTGTNPEFESEGNRTAHGDFCNGATFTFQHSKGSDCHLFENKENARPDLEMRKSFKIDRYD